MRGKHLIKHWSRTQTCVALSSGEAELYAIAKGSTETLGLIQVAKEMGVEQSGAICTDSSAAKGTVSRSGGGRLKHISVNHLWVQEKSQRGELAFRKIPRNDNPSDALTHYWETNSGVKHFLACNVCVPVHEKK